MGSYVWPCPQFSYISSKFGMRTHPITKIYKLHSGVDIASAKGNPIIATRPGTVTSAGTSGGYGKLVTIDHGGGITSRYAHCNTILVSVGNKVAAGQKIATVGKTGTATGYHLHFEIRVNGKAKNPEDYVRQSDTLSKYTAVGTGLVAGAVAGASGISSSSGSSGSSSSSTTKEYYDSYDEYLESAQTGEAEATAAKDITQVVVKSITGTQGARKYTALRSADAVLATGFEILIQENNEKIHLPAVEGDVTLEYERKGSPGVLTFNVVNDEALSFYEGNPVSLRVDGTKLFYGYVFKKKRNKDGIITVTCYDQLRYLKNKDTMIYENKKYSEVLKTIADSNGLQTGTIEDTGYVIPFRNEEGTLFDMLCNAAEDTVLNNSKLFVLYDDCGSICLKNIENMVVPILIDNETAEDFDYTSSIDDKTYNKIVMALDNSETGERELYIAQDEGTQSEWGTLQHYEKSESSTTTASTSSSSSTSGGSKTTSQTGIDLIKGFEGCRLTAYRDSGGTLTIGYGHTLGVTSGMTISQAQAESYLKSDLQTFESAVNSYVTVPLTQNMFDALVSLSYNIGSNAFKGSTLLSKLNQGDYTAAADQFGAWVKSGGTTLNGLVKRRAAEKQLFLAAYSESSEVTNVSVTNDATILKEKANVLLSYYNKKQRTLQIKGCFGDVRVRGGSIVVVSLDIGDMVVSNYMVVETVKHHFSNCKHTMDIKVVGIRGEFVV